MIENIKQKYPNGRGYLYENRISPSQLDTLKSSKKSYIKQYILGQSFSNKYTNFGSEVHKQLEIGEYTIPLVDVVALQIEDSKTSTKEHKFELPYTLINKEIILSGIIDYYDAEKNLIRDNKCIKANTSPKIYTQSDIANSTQLNFYCAYHKLTTGRDIINLGYNNILYREHDDGSLHLTGDVVMANSMETRHSAVDKTMKEIANFINEVENITAEDVEEVLSDKMTDLPPEILEVYHQTIELEMKSKEVETLIDKNKNIINTYMELQGLEKINHPEMTVSISNRKKYTYSSAVEELDTKLKELKKSEEATLQPELTKVITYKLK